MDLNLKTYKQHKIKKYFQKLNLLFFFYGPLLDTNNWIEIEQILTNLGLKHYHITNKLIVQTVKNSIFANLTALIHAPVMLLNCNSLLIFKQLQSINSLALLSLKINNKVYSKKQLQNLKKASYVDNVLVLYNSIKTFTQLPYCRLKESKIISK